MPFFLVTRLVEFIENIEQNVETWSKTAVEGDEEGRGEGGPC